MTVNSLTFLIPNFATQDSFVDNVTYTLRKMGHQVITPKAPFRKFNDPLSRQIYQALGSAFPNQWSPAEKWAVAACREHNIDVVLCLTQPIRHEVLEIFRSNGVKRLVAWWGDTPANMKGMGLLTVGWDSIYLKDGDAVKKFEALGLPAQLMHEACNPDWHFKNFDSINSNVIVAGNYYGYRQALVSKLLDAGHSMALYGPKPPRWALPEISDNHLHKFIVKEEKSQVFGSGLACLNSTALSEGNSLNCRAFEIAGAHGLQLIENKPSVSICFDPGSEVLTYESVSEVSEHLERAAAEPDWALKIREAGHKRAYECHTYEIRLERIIRNLKLQGKRA